jgi:hypothetical protein
MTFEITLELGGFVAIAERYGCAYLPRAMLRGVRAFAGVVTAQPVGEMVGEAGVVAFGVAFALQNIYDAEFLHGLPGRSSERGSAARRRRPRGLGQLCRGRLRPTLRSGRSLEAGGVEPPSEIA